MVSILRLLPSQEIVTVNTFGRQPLAPQVLSAFTVISDQMHKYSAIRICTGYYRVGYFPQLLVLPKAQKVLTFENLITRY